VFTVTLTTAVFELSVPSALLRDRTIALKSVPQAHAPNDARSERTPDADARDPKSTSLSIPLELIGTSR
jgi:hypothetical protein